MKSYFESQPPLKTRKFFDPVTLQTWVKENAKNSFADRLNKIESPDFKLKVENIDFAKDEKDYSLEDQKKAILEKRDLAIPLKGTFSLIDKKTDKVVDTKTCLIAQVPYITPRNTTIINGAEYITINQQRLKPGVYTRIKESGEAEAHVNVTPGTGLSGKIIFHPETTIFVYELGTTQIKLYGLLRGLGVSDMEMETAWGKEIFNKNRAAFKGDELDKFHARINTFK
jgi:DNA-directed RNA polymerase beta subunit